MNYIYVLCEVAIVSQLFIPFLFITWDCVKMTLLVVPRHVGDIAASWALQVGIRAIPDLGAPCLIESMALLSLEQKCFES